MDEFMMETYQGPLGLPLSGSEPEDSGDDNHETLDYQAYADDT
jgi:hypothetical protein